MSTLEKNLEALVSYQPKLVQRIPWPVDGSQVRFENGNVNYHLNLSKYDLNFESGHISEIPEAIDDGLDILVFGIGPGEQIDILLERFPNRNFRIWERDPWLLRIFVMPRDYSLLPISFIRQCAIPAMR